MKHWRVVVVLAVMALGSGCSVKFAYNNLDRFVRWGISDYVSLNDEQRRLFDAEFAKLHQWHRINHLPQYSELLESLPAMLADGVDPVEVTTVENKMMSWADELETIGTPLVIDMMCSLTDEQVARLPQRLEASNKEIAEPEMAESLDASQARWRDEVGDMFSRFAGRLSEEQRKYLAAQSVRYVPERVLWAEYRRRWQADLLALLAEREDRNRFAERYRLLAASRESYYGAELTHVFDRNEALSREVGGWLLNHMTERQQERMFERLTELAEEFRELAAQGNESTLPLDSCLLTC